MCTAFLGDYLNSVSPNKYTPIFYHWRIRTEKSFLIISQGHKRNSDKMCGEKKGEKSGEISQYFCVQPWALKAETEVECDVLGQWTPHFSLLRQQRVLKCGAHASRPWPVHNSLIPARYQVWLLKVNLPTICYHSIITL